MKNYTQAKSAFEEYCKFIRMNNRVPDYSISEKMTEYGYENVSEFLQDDRQRCFDEVNPIVISDTVGIPLAKVLADGVAMQEDALIFMHVNTLTAYAPENISTEQRAILEDNGISIETYAGKGGIIISAPEDFAYYLITSDSRFSAELLNQKFAEYISEKLGVEATVDHNDIMLGDKKVAGSVCAYSNNKFLHGLALSLTDHADLIRTVCLKDSVKEPSYVSGLALSEMENAVRTWFCGGEEEA